MQFQDGSRGGAVVLPVSYLMSLRSSEVQSLPTDQISSIQLRYDYFRFGKQTTAISEFFFRLRLRAYHNNQRAILHQTTKFHPNWASRGGVMTSYTFSRWLLRRLHTSSSFVFDDITLIRRSKSIGKPNFVEVS